MQDLLLQAIHFARWNPRTTTSHFPALFQGFLWSRSSQDFSGLEILCFNFKHIPGLYVQTLHIVGILAQISSTMLVGRLTRRPLSVHNDHHTVQKNKGRKQWNSSATSNNTTTQSLNAAMWTDIQQKLTNRNNRSSLVQGLQCIIIIIKTTN